MHLLFYTWMYTQYGVSIALISDHDTFQSVLKPVQYAWKISQVPD